MTTPPRRRVSRGPACDDRPRLWGDESAAAAPAPVMPPAEVGVESVPAPRAAAAALPPADETVEAPSLAAAAAVAPPAPIDQAVAAPDETYVATPVAPSGTLAPSGQTLEDLIAGTFDGLVAGEETTCPVCAAPMTPRWSAGAGVVGGRCGGCGTTLE